MRIETNDLPSTEREYQIYDDRYNEPHEYTISLATSQSQ